MRDGVTGSRFPSDWDQRHTVNVYGGYRIRPTVNLSGRWTYGSGFPIPGYFAKNGPNYVLAALRNRVRVQPYSRADARVNKSWIKDHWKFTLYGEVVNVTNRKNVMFDILNGFAANRQAFLAFDTLFPILPSAGIAFER
jgi:hypothetical protein